jgi:MOSC domain-containing protein YiiM
MAAPVNPDVPNRGQDGVVRAVASSPVHRFAKDLQAEITLVAGHGVAGDTHAGPTVQHRSRVRRDPSAPNLRQVHLIAEELFDEVASTGHAVAPGDLGENVTTAGVDLLALPTGALLRLGDDAVVEVTGLRNPCRQIDGHSPGLMGELVSRAADGTVVRRAGVMAVVRRGGVVRPGDALHVVPPDGPHSPLQPV